MAEKSGGNPRGKRKTRAAVPGLENHRGKWRWRPRIDGIRQTIPLAAKSESEAIVEVLQLQKRPQGKVTGSWPDAVQAYLAAGRGAGKLSDVTAENRGWTLEAIGRELELKSPRHLTPAVAERWVSLLREKHLPTSVRDYVRHARAFAKWCVDSGRMAADPFLGLSLPSTESNTREIFLEAPQVARLLLLARNAGDRDMEWILALGTECGMRRAEIAACRPEWFDQKRGSVTVPAQDAKDDSKPSDTWKRKGRAGRRKPATVPLSETMLELIARHGLPSPFIIAPGKAWGKSRYRFEFRKRFEKFMADAGHPEITIHDLRRSFASNRVSAGVTIEKVANWMGIHRNTAWTRYARFIPADADINKGTAREAVKAVPEAAAGPSVAAAATVDPAERLRKVEGLFAGGLITEEERLAKRAEILRDL